MTRQHRCCHEVSEKEATNPNQRSGYPDHDFPFKYSASLNTIIRTSQSHLRKDYGNQMIPFRLHIAEGAADEYLDGFP
jgi:hypothetical protein